ncbi:hypothetical protein [Pleomorphochaeta sp. DL1XJH-081]|uniref:hypothetical protein n=1 Tax=Pleomorphochaeta sp. DL1XJH-081 TaxID=3409690 RepID=UPI002B3B5E7C|nr:hypothetical protein [Sphaerochaeta sp.]
MIAATTGIIAIRELIGNPGRSIDLDMLPRTQRMSDNNSTVDKQVKTVFPGSFMAVSLKHFKRIHAYYGKKNRND